MTGVESVMNSEAGSLRICQKNYGEEETRAMLVWFISDLCSFFNFNRTMNGNQIIQTCDLIMESFNHFTPEDFIMCFNNIKLGKYGKMYEGIDGSKIMEFMRKYDEDFVIEEQEYYRKKVDEKRNERVEWSDEVVKAIKPVLSKMTGQKSEPIKEVKKTPGDIVQGWLRNFDKIYNLDSQEKWRREKRVENDRFILRFGRIFDQTEWLNKKQEQYNRLTK